MDASPDNVAPKPARARRGRPWSSIVAIATAGLVALGTFLAWITYDDYQDTLAQEFRFLEGHAHSGDVQLAGALRSIDLLLQSVIDDQLMSPPLSAEVIQRAQLGLLQQFPEVHFLLVTDSHGQVLTAESVDDPTDIGAVRHFNASQRDYFVAHRDAKPDGRDHYEISRPFKTITGKHTIAISRAIRDGDGHFMGVAAVSISPKYFETVLRQIMPDDPSSAAILVNRFGDVIFGVRGTETYAGQNILGAAPFQAFLKSNQRLTRHIGLSALDTSNRIYAMTRIDEVPLGLSVSTQLDHVTARWRSNLVLRLLGFVLMAAVTLLLAMEVERRLHERRRSEARLRESEARYRLLAENSHDVIWTIDIQSGRFTYVSPSVQRLRGYTVAEIMAQPIEESLTPDSALRVREAMRETLGRIAAGDRNNLTTVSEVDQPHRDGHVVHTEVVTTYLLDDAGRPVSILGVTRDVTERKKAERALEKLAQIDELTGLANRRHFMLMAEQELSRMVRYGGVLSVLMMDIDHFKQVNDTYGHHTGDLVLRELGRLCRDTLRDVDFVGRIGGEEFAVMLPQTNGTRALEVAERLRQAIERAEVPLERGLPLHFTLSIGVTTMCDGNANIDSLLDQADKALYRAKRGGRNRVCVYGENEDD